MATNPTSAILELKIDFGLGADANLTGVVLSRLAVAYAKHCRALGVSNARLVVKRVEIASLFAQLEAVIDVVKGAQHIYENWDLLERFVRDVGATVITLQSGNIVDIPSYMRSLVEAMIAPVHEGKSTRTTMRITNTEGASVEIDSDNVDILHKALGVSRQMLRQDRRPVKVGIPAETDLTYPLLIDKSTHATGAGMLPVISEQYSHSGSTHGTLVFALGTWYVRPASLSGVMLPASLDLVDRKIQSDETYLVSGRMTPEEGAPNKFSVHYIDRKLD